MLDRLTILKIGGSVITDKSKILKPNIFQEISRKLQANRKKPRLNNNEKPRKILTLVSTVSPLVFTQRNKHAF